MMSNKILDKTCKYIKKYGLLENEDTVVAGVSGGADSICMLMMLIELRKLFDLNIIVAHVNHGIRGEEAKRDAEFVSTFCHKNDLKFVLAEADIIKLAQESGMTCEEAGRDFRYEFFCDIAQENNAKKIAVAHNSGDNAETVLFNIFRGSGLGGLKGILPSRSIKDKHGHVFSLIRPILSLSRNEIEEFLAEKGQNFCVDRTNSENDYSRNRIRNIILPLAAEKINSNAIGHIGALSRQVSDVYDFILQETEKNLFIISTEKDNEGSNKLVRINGRELKRLHSVIRKNLIRSAIEMSAGRLKDVEENHVLAIEELTEKQSGKRISLPYGITVTKEYDDIILTRENTESVFSENNRKYRSTEANSIILKIFDRNELPEEIPRCPEEKWFDYDKIGGNPEVRKPLEGDFLIIGKEAHTKSLSRFFIDKKIPATERNDIPVLAIGNHVLWVIGVRQDDSCYVTQETKRILVAKKNVSEKVKE